TVGNLGNLTMTAGTLTLNTGGVVTVPSLTLPVPVFTQIAGTSSLAVTGATIKSGVGYAEILVPFNNTGGVDIQDGFLGLMGAGTHSNSLIGAGAVILGGNHTFNLGSSVTVSEVYVDTGGYTQIFGTYDLT